MTSEQLHKIAQEYLKQLAEGKAANKATCTAFDFAVKRLAKRNHETWCDAKRKDGFVPGEYTDNEAKTSHLLVPFEQLPADIKADNIRNAKKTIEMCLKAGFQLCQRITPEDKEALLESMIEELHDDWALAKMDKGYVFGEKRNDDPTKGQLTHHDLLPASVLKEVYPKDYAYDRKTAEGVLESLEQMGFVLCYDNSMPATATC